MISRSSRASIIFAFSSFLLFWVVFICCCFGASDFSLFEELAIFSKKGNLGGGYVPSDMVWTIFFELRLPRALAAAFCGAALAVAGGVAQGLFRENLASPTVLGTEAGSSLVSLILFYYGIGSLGLTLPLGAFFGAILATILVLLVAQRSAGEGQPLSISTLLLVGFALNAFVSAVTSLFVAISLQEPRKAAQALSWMMGGFAAKSWEHVWLVGLAFIVGLVLALRIAQRLDILSLGEDVAASLSISTHSLRNESLITMAILVAGAVSVAGPLPFVSLVVPHMTRRFAGPHHRRLVCYTSIYGAILVLLADLLGRMLQRPAELSAGILTGFIGAPFFIILLLQRKES